MCVEPLLSCVGTLALLVNQAGAERRVPGTESHVSECSVLSVECLHEDERGVLRASCLQDEEDLDEYETDDDDDDEEDGFIDDGDADDNWRRSLRRLTG